jgi:hypothetical protein
MAFVPDPIGTPKRREQDKEMILSPDRWPTWPKLPLKRHGYEQNHGFAFNGSLKDDNTRPRVYLATIFHAIDDATLYIEYTDIDALLDDGWTVD